MAEWLKILLSALGGGIISGGFLLVADYLRHRRRRVEHCHEILTEKRIEACRELMRLILDLEAALDPLHYGVRHFREAAVVGDPAQELRERLAHIAERYAELSRHVCANEMLLGPNVMAVIHRYWSALHRIQIEAEYSETKQIVLSEAMRKLLDEFADTVGEAVRQALGSEEIAFLSRVESRKFQEEGQKHAVELANAAEAELRSHLQTPPRDGRSTQR